jgi:outer membrane protein assembly factor BamB
MRRLGGAGVARIVALAASLVVLWAPINAEGSSTQAASAATPSPWDWPSYGHDAQHTFAGRTTLTPSSVRHLATAWFYPTKDAVTATPTEAAGTVYFGSWDTWFYAVSLSTGKLRWKFHLDQQHGVTPYPGQTPRDSGSDGGLVTSSAWYQPGTARRPDLVIFGGGYTLYALNAHTGALYWKHRYPGNPALRPRPGRDDARIFSSPVVADHLVLFGLSVDGEPNERGYVVAADLHSGDPVWTYETDVSQSGQVLNDGCGNVWSSGTVLPRAGLVVFDEADCHFSDPPPTAESVFALRITDGHLVWRYRPHRPDNHCDYDFGATPNAGVTADGKVTFLGVGGKDGTYYSLHPLTGHLRWKRNVDFGGSSGGFIGSTAYNGHVVVGSTGLGDYSGPGSTPCQPSNPRDTAFQEPTVHAFAKDGRVLWQQRHAASFGSTTIAGGMSFNAVALSPLIEVRSVAGGRLLGTFRPTDPSWSGVATVGNALLFGTGSDPVYRNAGVYAVTPGGVAPKVPAG